MFMFVAGLYWTVAYVIQKSREGNIESIESIIVTAVCVTVAFTGILSLIAYLEQRNAVPDEASFSVHFDTLIHIRIADYPLLEVLGNATFSQGVLKCESELCDFEFRVTPEMKPTFFEGTLNFKTPQDDAIPPMEVRVYRILQDDSKFASEGLDASWSETSEPLLEIYPPLERLSPESGSSFFVTCMGVSGFLGLAAFAVGSFVSSYPYFYVVPVFTLLFATAWYVGGMRRQKRNLKRLESWRGTSSQPDQHASLN
jgi:hypothetical protein